MLAINYVNSLQAELGVMDTILVANQDIDPYTLLTTDMVRTAQIPRKFLQPSMVRDAETLGRSTTRVPLKRGDLITRPILMEVTDQPAHMRHITLHAGKSVVMEPDIAAGDRVDIIASYRDGKADQDVTQVALVNVEVVSTNPKGISLLLDMEQANQLIWLENYGRQLRVLRRPLG